MKRPGRKRQESAISSRPTLQSPASRRRTRDAPTAKPVAFDLVRKLGLSLPDVEEATMYGAPALKVHGKMFVCMTSHKSAEPNTLVVRMDFDQRDELIATDPSTYYLKDHYVGYATVLVRLSRVHPEALSDLLLTAWRFVTAKERKRARPERRTNSASARRGT